MYYSVEDEKWRADPWVRNNRKSLKRDKYMGYWKIRIEYMFQCMWQPKRKSEQRGVNKILWIQVKKDGNSERKNQ